MDALLLVLAQGSGQGDAPDAGPGILIILGVVVAIVALIAAVWTFAARRGSSVPGDNPVQRGASRTEDEARSGD